MFLIHPPVGVPIANVPEVLKRANSRKVADLVVNYFKMTPEEDQNPYLRRQTKSNYYSNSRFKKNANFERDDFGRTIVNLTDNKFAADDLRSQVYFDNEQVSIFYYLTNHLDITTFWNILIFEIKLSILIHFCQSRDPRGVNCDILYIV